ncbi:MAG TPA: hypothetical protein VHQ90_15690 [Thermoanaerobaculia bacterium]|nr:hypothetical protein [Thermoanaerobaculia bacterium]
MTISVLDAERDRRGLEAFLALPSRVYEGDPNYCASGRDAVVASLRRREFAGRQLALVAVEGNGGARPLARPFARPIARLVARLSPALADPASGRPYGLLGFFEAIPGEAGAEAAGMLFAAAAAWLRGRGAGAIVGPMDGDTWHRYRLNAGPWDEPPFLLEPYNLPGYPALWQANGFRVLASYSSRRIDDAAAVAEHLGIHRRQALAAGYRLRPLDARRFSRELGLLHELSCAIFAENFLYTEIPRAEFAAVYAGARPLIDPELVWFAETGRGEPAGFLFAYPDHFRAVASMRGGRGPLARLRCLRELRRGRPAAVNFKTVGVLREHRRAGLGAALVAQGYDTALRKGFRSSNHCLILEGNPSAALDAGRGRLLRRYHLYQLAGGADPAGSIGRGAA